MPFFILSFCNKVPNWNKNECFFYSMQIYVIKCDELYLTIVILKTNH